MVLIVDPAQSEQAEEIMSRYCQIVDEHAGKIIRAENWGREVSMLLTVSSRSLSIRAL